MLPAKTVLVYHLITYFATVLMMLCFDTLFNYVQLEFVVSELVSTAMKSDQSFYFEMLFIYSPF